jgi:hypothetical protein
MNTEDIELMINVLKGNIAGLEMMNTSEYIKLQNNADEFQDVPRNSLHSAINKLNEIVNCLDLVVENRKSPQDIMSAVNDAIGIPGFF